MTSLIRRRTKSFLLQDLEHCFNPANLDHFDKILQYFAFSSSAINSGVLRVRPSDGVAALVKRNLGHLITTIDFL